MLEHFELIKAVVIHEIKDAAISILSKNDKPLLTYFVKIVQICKTFMLLRTIYIYIYIYIYNIITI